MSTINTKLNKSIVSLLNFTGQTVTNNLISASRQKIVDISENDLRKIAAIVENSVTQSLVNGYSSVEKVINEVSQDSRDSKKSHRKR